MKLAVLFWCYKKPEICEDRVRHIRRDNPDIQIFVLFGGKHDEAHIYERALQPYIDDFFVFDESPPPACEHLATKFRGGVHWKYLYGDLLIANWFKNRGRNLDWDTVVVLQWDMLVFGRIDEVYRCLKPGEILLSGLRPVQEVEKRWAWVSKKQPQARKMYTEFLQHVEERYGFTEEPLCCLAIVLAFPRNFLEKFSQIERPDLGFMEYRLPVYAQIFGTPFCTNNPFKPWWPAVERVKLGTTLRARLDQISLLVISLNLLRPKGARVFHPYWRKVATGPLSWLMKLKGNSRHSRNLTPVYSKHPKQVDAAASPTNNRQSISSSVEN